MIYGYRCRSCGRERDSQERDDSQPCECGDISRRVFSFVGKAPFTPHFNHAVGAHVSTDRQFDDLLKTRAEQNAERTGFDSNFVRVDPGDIPPTKDTEVFETRERIIKDKKLNPATLV